MTDKKNNTDFSGRKKRISKSKLAVIGLCLLVGGFFVLQGSTAKKSFAQYQNFLNDRTESASDGIVQLASWNGNKRGGRHGPMGDRAGYEDGDDYQAHWRGNKQGGRHGRMGGEAGYEDGDYHHNASWGSKRRGRKGLMGWFSELDDEDIEESVTEMVEHMSDEIDATPEQQQKIIEVVVPAVIEAQPLSESMSETRDELRELLTAETIDREALEKLRADRLAEMDQLSRTWVDTVAQVAEILTVEQREEIEDHFGSRKKRRGWWK